MSFECPHIDMVSGICLKLKGECRPGRRGCELAGRFIFVSPAEPGPRRGEPRDEVSDPFDSRLNERFDQGENT